MTYYINNSADFRDCIDAYERWWLTEPEEVDDDDGE